MRVCFDIDGTLSASPALCKLMCDLKAHGHKVVVLTGHHSAEITKADKKSKKADLAALGLKGCYDKLHVYPEASVSQCKAAYCKKHDVPLMIDNSMKTASLTDPSTTVVVPWHSIAA